MSAQFWPVSFDKNFHFQTVEIIGSHLKVYYFESVVTLKVFWVNMKEIDVSEKATTKKLPVSNVDINAGSVAKNFKPTQAFKFQGL